MDREGISISLLVCGLITYNFIKNAEGMHPSKHLSSMMGYTTSYDANMVVMAASQGKRHQVVNIGLNVKRITSDNVHVSQWAQSLQHKVRLPPNLSSLAKSKRNLNIEI